MDLEHGKNISRIIKALEKIEKVQKHQKLQTSPGSLDYCHASEYYKEAVWDVFMSNEIDMEAFLKSEHTQLIKRINDAE